MLGDCPLPTKSEFKNNQREVTKGFRMKCTDVEIVMWNNNGATTVGSNCESILPLFNAWRWSKEAKDYVNLPRSSMIGACNAFMGDTDQMDQFTASYRPLVRNHKWPWPLFIYHVKVSLSNSWLLYRSLEENCSFLDHIRSIKMSYLQTYKHNKKIVPSTETVFHNCRVT